MTHPSTGPADRTAGPVLEAYAAAVAARDWPGLRALLAPGFTATLLPAGDTHDADGFVAFNRDYPGAWTFHRDDVVDAGSRGVLRSRTLIGDLTWHAASFATLDDRGLLLELVEVWADPVTRTTPPEEGSA